MAYCAGNVVLTRSRVHSCIWLYCVYKEYYSVGLYCNGCPYLLSPLSNVEMESQISICGDFVNIETLLLWFTVLNNHYTQISPFHCQIYYYYISLIELIFSALYFPKLKLICKY